MNVSETLVKSIIELLGDCEDVELLYIIQGLLISSGSQPSQVQ